MNISKTLAFVGSIVVSLTIISALYTIGTPSEQRIIRFDEQRINDLRKISNSVEQHWKKTGQLPEQLSVLVDGQILEMLPTDPETKNQYDFEGITETSYKLCAILTKKTISLSPNDFWYYNMGMNCYEFKVSK